MDAKNLKNMRRINRERELEHQRLVGKRRAETWGGKPGKRQERRSTKRNLRNYL